MKNLTFWPVKFTYGDHQLDNRIFYYCEIRIKDQLS